MSAAQVTMPSLIDTHLDGEVTIITIHHYKRWLAIKPFGASTVERIPAKN